MSEARLFSARDLVVTSNLAAFGEKTPSDPGIAVWFLWKGTPKCIACDTYSELRANVRAVGLTIEALRSMDRYGTQMLDQLMSGVSALPSPDSVGDSRWSKLDEAKSLEELTTVFHELARKAHPDHGGSDEAFSSLNRAMERAKARLEAK